jgi:hypothetical protein
MIYTIKTKEKQFQIEALYAVKKDKSVVVKEDHDTTYTISGVLQLMKGK